jgi:hypothetical protein
MPGGDVLGWGSITWFLGGLDVETCRFLCAPGAHASTEFCEILLPEGLNIRMQFFIRIFDKVL